MGHPPELTAVGSAGFDALSRAREAVLRADRLVVLTGAGVSAESGIPTFRGVDGLWKERRPEELATREAFARDPRQVWEWYGRRRRLISACTPNPAHRALAELQGTRPGVTLVTQNVDGLHERAAMKRAPDAAPTRTEAAARLLELHGSLFRVRCTGCGLRAPHRAEVDARTVDSLPRCPACAALLRPDVVWFGEPLDPGVLEGAFLAAREADVCLVVGTSAVVHPAASLPLVTLDAGGVVVEVNLEPTPLTRCALASVRGPAGRVLPPLLDGPDVRSAGPTPDSDGR